MPKHHPSSIPDSITIGAFTFPTTVKISSVFGKLHQDLASNAVHPDPKFKDISNSEFTSSTVQFSNSVDQRCAKCLAVGHSVSSYFGPWRCKSCFNYGHKACWCLTRAKPRIFWAPKKKESTAHNTTEGASLDSRADFSRDPNLPGDPPSSPKHSTTQVESDSTSSQPSPAAMANFPCNPQLFVPQGLHVEHGWQRSARSRMVLGAEPTRRHEQYEILSMEPEPAQAQVYELLHEVVAFLQHEFPVRVISAFPSPLGLGLFQLENPIQRETLLDASPFWFGQSLIHVQRHDEAKNFRACAYIRES